MQQSTHFMQMTGWIQKIKEKSYSVTCRDSKPAPLEQKSEEMPLGNV
jgi:hypothetical protein